MAEENIDRKTKRDARLAKKERRQSKKSQVQDTPQGDLPNIELDKEKLGDLSSKQDLGATPPPIEATPKVAPKVTPKKESNVLSDNLTPPKSPPNVEDFGSKADYGDQDFSDPKRIADDILRGGTIDADGNKVTFENQVMDAVTRPDDLTDDRTFEEVQDEYESTALLPKILAEEKEKAEAVTTWQDEFFRNPDNKDLLTDILNGATTSESEQPLTMSDFENGVNSAIEDSETSIEFDEKLENLMQAMKGQAFDYGEPALEKLGLTDYYPDINTPIQIGSYSGSIIGNNPIFAAGGGYFPMGVYDARKRAMERAAQNKVKQGEKLKNLMLIDTAPQYMDKFHEHGLEMFNKYGEEVGWDWNRLTDQRNPEARAFQKDYQEYYSAGKRSLAINKRYETIMEEADGGKYLLPSTRKAMEEWIDGYTDIGGLIDDPSKMKNIEKAFKYYDHLTADAQKLVEKFDYGKVPLGKIPETEADFEKYNEEISRLSAGGGFEAYRTGSFEFVDAKRIMGVVETQIKHGNYAGDPEDAKNDMANYINNLLAPKLSTSYIQKAKQTSFSITNNLVKDGDQTQESRNRGASEEWRGPLPSLMKDGDASVQKHMSEVLLITPYKGDDGKFVNNEIAGYYPLTQDQNRAMEYPVNEQGIKYTFKKNGKVTTYNSMADLKTSILKGYGVSDDNINQIMNHNLWGEASAEINNRLVYGGQDDGSGENTVEAIPGLSGRVTREEAYILSRNDNDRINTQWNTKKWSAKIPDPNNPGKYIPLHTTDWDRTNEHVGFHDINGGLIDPETGTPFPNVGFSHSYNINEWVGAGSTSQTTADDTTPHIKAEEKNAGKGSYVEPPKNVRKKFN